MIEQTLDRPIAFHRIFVIVTNSITASLFLSQAIYWSKRTKNKDDWFYKTQVDWQEETGMVRREQETARKILKSLGILEEKLIGVPATLHYKINFEILENAINLSLSQTDKLDCHKPTNKNGRNRQTISENTALKEKINKKELLDSDRKSKIKKDFGVTDEMISWAEKKFKNKPIPLLELKEQTEQFVDYYIAKGERRADWFASWRTWIRNAIKFNNINYQNIEKPKLRVNPQPQNSQNSNTPKETPFQRRMRIAKENAPTNDIAF